MGTLPVAIFEAGKLQRGGSRANLRFRSAVSAQGPSRCNFRSRKVATGRFPGQSAVPKGFLQPRGLHIAIFEAGKLQWGSSWANLGWVLSFNNSPGLIHIRHPKGGLSFFLVGSDIKCVCLVADICMCTNTCAQTHILVLLMNTCAHTQTCERDLACDM